MVGDEGGGGGHVSIKTILVNSKLINVAAIYGISQCHCLNAPNKFWFNSTYEPRHVISKNAVF